MSEIFALNAFSLNVPKRESVLLVKLLSRIRKICGSGFILSPLRGLFQNKILNLKCIKFTPYKEKEKNF